MNDLIVRKIKEARKERGLTQKDLANHLGRTAASISDLERGKVQVTASDLYHISQLLNKPIEYFYGEEFGDSAIQDLVAIVRKQPLNEQANTIELSRMLMQMQEIGDLAKSIPEGEEMPIEKVKEFYNSFIPFSIAINKMNELITDLRDKFESELKIRGINITK